MHEVTESQARAAKSIVDATGPPKNGMDAMESRWKTRRMETAKLVETWPKKKGKREYLKALRGEHVSFRQMCLAMCYSCSCGDPGPGCASPTCPLFDFQRKVHKPDYSQGWLP